MPIITKCQKEVPNTFSSSSKFILKQQNLSFLRDKYLRHCILGTVKSVKDSAHPIQKHRNHGKDAVFLYTFKLLSTLSWWLPFPAPEILRRNRCLNIIKVVLLHKNLAVTSYAASWVLLIKAQRSHLTSLFHVFSMSFHFNARMSFQYYHFYLFLHIEEQKPSLPICRKAGKLDGYYWLKGAKHLPWVYTGKQSVEESRASRHIPSVTDPRLGKGKVSWQVLSPVAKAREGESLASNFLTLICQEAQISQESQPHRHHKKSKRLQNVWVTGMFSFFQLKKKS